MANGWTLERRQRQAELINTWKPWIRSTGARTIEGKARSSQNARVHGCYFAAAKAELKRVKDLLTLITNETDGQIT